MKTHQRIAIWGLLCFIMALMLSCGAMLSHGREVSTPRPNGLGVVIPTINPNTSLIGSIVNGTFIHDKDGRTATAVTIHPKGMYSLFDEGIAFCGDQADNLSTPDGHILQGILVFTYRRQASRLVDGVPCFELRSVYDIVERLP